MQSLMHACIFCTSNPRGQTTFFASYVLEGNTFSPGSIFFIIFSNFSNPLSVVPFSAFHCSNSSVVPNFSGHLRNLCTTVCCDPLTFSPTSTSPFHFRSLSLHQEWSDPNRHRGHQKSAHQKWALLPLRLPPFYYHRLQ